MALSASEARAQLFPLIRRVNDDQEAVEVTSKEGGAVFIVPAEEYLSLRETVYLLSSRANAEHLRASLAEAEVGHVEAHELLT